MKKRIVSAFLALCLLLTLLPVTTLAQETQASALQLQTSDEGWLWPVPLEGSCVTSPYNIGNSTLKNRRGSDHEGIDIVRTGGGSIPVYASRSGTVVYVKNEGKHDTKNGIEACRVVIQHTVDGQTVYSGYWHLKSGSIGVYQNGVRVADLQEGTYIEQGTQIAMTGDTGIAYGIHLHFCIGTGYCGYSSTKFSSYTAHDRKFAGLYTWGSAADYSTSWNVNPRNTEIGFNSTYNQTALIDIIRNKQLNGRYGIYYVFSAAHTQLQQLCLHMRRMGYEFAEE